MTASTERPIIITNCTQRKRRSAGVAIRLANCLQGSGDPVDAWLRAISSNTIRTPAAALYCGRSFQDAIAATETAGGALWIASAGVGLIPGEKAIPCYSATVTKNSSDSVPLPPKAWFTALQQRSPFASTPDLKRQPLVLAALSSPYLRMMEDWLLEFVEQNPGRLRLFSRVSKGELPSALRPYLLPYDARLDDPSVGCPGTVSDFAQRALRHFVAMVLKDQSAASLEIHHNAVAALLSLATKRQRPANRQISDAEVCAMIRTHWQAAGGRSGRMLALLRGTLGIACEQSRFARLFRSVAADSHGVLV